MNVVLYQPQIPANTGNIARLCAVTDSRLHLIRPLGFFLDDRHLKRAGMDYWQYVHSTIHDSWEAFLDQVDDKANVFFIETGGSIAYTKAPFRTDDYLVFGSESSGIPDHILAQSPEKHLTIPMLQGRSLNLSSTAAIVVYEAWRQCGFIGMDQDSLIRP